MGAKNKQWNRTERVRGEVGPMRGSTAAERNPCARIFSFSASGDWKMKSKDLDFNYMVDYRPRDTLTEGRGW
jgi:hypothetical protein